MRAIYLLFTILLTIGSNFSQKNEQNCFEKLNADDFNLKMNQDNTLVFDVRVFKEYKKSRISGASSIPDKKTLVSYCNNVDVNTTLLVYCSDGFRSETAALILCDELGYKNIYSLKNGLESWKKRGYHLEKTNIRKK